MRPTPGALLGRYRILRVVAEGGMGTIYEARHEGLGTSVALKFLHPELARRQGLVARFLQEARVSAALRSPFIVQVLDVEQDANGAYLVMELLSGESLQSALDRLHRIPKDQAIDVAVQVLAGLAVAHQAHVVHRDLKPDNVFLVPTQQGTRAVILDFGIAKLRTSPDVRDARAGLTRPGVTMGTPEYMAPEQAYSADSVDVRADLYAVGVMLFEMLSGQRPVGGDDARAIANAVLERRVTSLGMLDASLPQGLVEVIHRAMEPRADRRFASAAEMQRALVPFAGVLSGVGHQAAASLAWGGPGAPAPEPPRAVAKTLPPEGADGATTAPREPLPQAIFTPAPAYVPPPSARAPVAATAYDRGDHTHLSPGPPPAVEELRQSAAPPRISYGPPPASYGSPGMPMATPPPGLALPALSPPRKRGTSLPLVAVIAAVAGGGLVLGVLALRSRNEASDPVQPTTPTATMPTAPVTATITTPVTVTAPLPTAPLPTAPTATHTTGAGSAKPVPKDAGAPDAGGVAGFPPFPGLPEGGLPPIPSGIPTSITFPIPGFPAPR